MNLHTLFFISIEAIWVRFKNENGERFVVDLRQPGVERLRVNGGDLALPRGRILKMWRETV